MNSNIDEELNHTSLENSEDALSDETQEAGVDGMQGTQETMADGEQETMADGEQETMADGEQATEEDDYAIMLLLQEAEKQLQEVESRAENGIEFPDSVNQEVIEVEEEEVTQKSLFYRVADFLDDVVASMAFTVLIAYLVMQFILIHAVVPSGSMENTIMTGDYIFANRLAYILEEPKRGEIIIFWSDEYQELMIKRVVGIPGDTVKIADGRLYVNDIEIIEPYIRGTTVDYGKGDTWVVPEDAYFVMGDSRSNSADSRYWINSYVPEEEIIAKYLVRYGIRDKRFFIQWNKPVDAFQALENKES